MKSFSDNVELTNVDSPFAELFSILKRYRLSQDSVELAYEKHELSILGQHSDNAIELLLQGLQDLGVLVSKVRKINPSQLVGLGGLISGLSNLTEALVTLRRDVEFGLRQ